VPALEATTLQSPLLWHYRHVTSLKMVSPGRVGLAAPSLKPYASAMLQKLRTGLGFRAAMLVALLAALCLVAPPAVIAFGHGDNTAHCLANADAVNHGMHGNGEQDHHGDRGKSPGTHAPGCCGLYCMSALPLTPGPMVEGPIIRPALSLLPEIAFTGRGPDQLDRPPISLLSV